MTQPAKVQEPSMEEILASIRRIIADDETAAPATPQPADVKAAPTPSATIPTAAASSLRSPVQDTKPSPERNAEPKLATKEPDPLDQLLAEGIGEVIGKGVSPAKAETDIFELTDDMALASTSTPANDIAKDAGKDAGKTFNKVEPADDIVFADLPPHPETRHRPAPEASASMRSSASSSKPSADKPDIMSNATMSAVESAFNSLATTVLSNNARTLEDLVREMLRPMLKTWLDDNLPGLVERIVRAEIERVSRGR